MKILGTWVDHRGKEYKQIKKLGHDGSPTSGYRLGLEKDRLGQPTRQKVIIIDDVIKAAKAGNLPGHPREGLLLEKDFEPKLEGKILRGEGYIEPLTEDRPYEVIGGLQTIKMSTSESKSWGGSHEYKISPPADVYANGDIIIRRGSKIELSSIFEDEHPPQ